MTKATELNTYKYRQRSDSLTEEEAEELLDVIDTLQCNVEDLEDEVQSYEATSPEYLNALVTQALAAAPVDDPDSVKWDRYFKLLQLQDSVVEG